MTEFAHAAAAASFPPDDSLVYKKVDNLELRLYRFNPPGHKNTDKTPVIIFFFGGGWINGAPSQFYPHCRYLASRGIVALAADYRTQTKNGTTPQECVKDGKSAIRWVRSHAAELGIDPGKIIAGGGSAGGHVATATATLASFNEEGENTSVDCRPNALVLFNPVFDNGPDGYGYDRVKDYWQEFSPMNNIGPRMPPTVVFLGTRDNLIPVATAEKFKQLVEQQGQRCDLHLYEGQAHGFFNYSNTEYFLKTLEQADIFLTSLGYLSGPPTMDFFQENHP